MDNNWLNESKGQLFDSFGQTDNVLGGSTQNNVNTGGEMFSGSTPLFSDGSGFGNNNGSYNGGGGDEDWKNGDFLDKLMHYSWVILCGIGSMIFGFFISIKEIFVVISKSTAVSSLANLKRLLFTFIPCIVLGIVFYIIGYVQETSFWDLGIVIGFGSICAEAISGFLITLIKFNTYQAVPTEKVEKILENQDNIQEIDGESDEEDISNYSETVKLESAYSDSFEDIMKDILGDDLDELNKIANGEDTEEDNTLDFEEQEDEPEEEKGLEIATPDIVEGMTITNQTLWKVFSPLFPALNKNFAKRIEWTDSNEYAEKWSDLYTIIMRVFADIFQMDITEIKEKNMVFLLVEDAPMFTYIELRKPSKGKQIDSATVEKYLNNYSEDIMNTICNKNQLYSDEDSNKISARVWLSGDHYCIILTKPNKNAVLIGDVLLNAKVQEALESGKNTPVVMAVDDLGKPIIAEMTHKSQMLYSGLIGGGAGSGKSWFFFATLIQLAAFNKPTDIQFMLVDPKPDPAFNEFDLLPHCARLIQAGKPEGIAKPTMDMLEKLVKEEGPRRQKLFGTESCANIQDWRKKGHTDMPFIFVFLDEYINLRDEIQRWGEELYDQELEEFKESKAAGEKGLVKPEKVDKIKELDKLMGIATTKLRAAGIYFYIISHRFTGVVDKQTRVLSPLKLVLKSNKLLTEVFEGEDVKNFTKKLINSGDCALKLGEKDLYSAKTLGVCMEDADTYKIIESIAKGFYKMGVEMPDLSALGKEYKKDIESIKKKLYGDSSNTVQFSDNNEENQPVDLDDENEDVELTSNDNDKASLNNIENDEEIEEEIPTNNENDNEFDQEEQKKDLNKEKPTDEEKENVEEEELENIKEEDDLIENETIENETIENEHNTIEIEDEEITNDTEEELKNEESETNEELEFEQDIKENGIEKEEPNLLENDDSEKEQIDVNTLEFEEEPTQKDKTKKSKNKKVQDKEKKGKTKTKRKSTKKKEGSNKKDDENTEKTN